MKAFINFIILVFSTILAFPMLFLLIEHVVSEEDSILRKLLHNITL
jgi:ABC-type phosphate/phosphonate transport system permease subunit